MTSVFFKILIIILNISAYYARSDSSHSSDSSFSHNCPLCLNAINNVRSAVSSMNLTTVQIKRILNDQMLDHVEDIPDIKSTIAGIPHLLETTNTILDESNEALDRAVDTVATMVKSVSEISNKTTNILNELAEMQIDIDSEFKQLNGDIYTQFNESTSNINDRLTTLSIWINSDMKKLNATIYSQFHESTANTNDRFTSLLMWTDIQFRQLNDTIFNEFNMTNLELTSLRAWTGTQFRQLNETIRKQFSKSTFNINNKLTSLLTWTDTQFQDADYDLTVIDRLIRTHDNSCRRRLAGEVDTTRPEFIVIKLNHFYMFMVIMLTIGAVTFAVKRYFAPTYKEIGANA